MSAVNTTELVDYLAGLLSIEQTPDSSNAFNGLQVENGGTVTRIAVAVDSSERTILRATEKKCDLLIVHHGLLWDGNGPITGARYRKLSHLIKTGTALYAVHIPLDLHPTLGNNAVLARLLEVETKGTFGDYKGVAIGVWGELGIRREALAARLDDVLGVRVRMIPGGPEIIQRVGIVSGAAAGMMGEAVRLGLDAFITGEGNHHTYAEAEERGINLYYGGHYATEVWGVKALGAHLQEKFDLPWEFIDLPTGM